MSGKLYFMQTGRRDFMKGSSKASVRFMSTLQAFLLLMMIVVPALSFGESEGTINIGPELQSQLTSDGLPPLNTFLPYAASPPLRCLRLNTDQSAISRISLPGNTSVNIYVFDANAGTDDERLICDIANHPNDPLLIDQGTWSAPATFSVPLILGISVSGGPGTALVLIVGNQTSDYTFLGPIGINQDTPCNCASLIPAFDHWGLVLFALLLLVSTFWFVRRKKAS
jgi:hypothetical protein